MYVPGAAVFCLLQRVSIPSRLSLFLHIYIYICIPHFFVEMHFWWWSHTFNCIFAFAAGSYCFYSIRRSSRQLKGDFIFHMFDYYCFFF